MSRPVAEHPAATLGAIVVAPFAVWVAVDLAARAIVALDRAGYLHAVQAWWASL